MLTYFVYAPLLIQIGALSLDVIWGFKTTSGINKYPTDYKFSNKWWV